MARDRLAHASVTEGVLPQSLTNGLCLFVTLHPVESPKIRIRNETMDKHTLWKHRTSLGVCGYTKNAFASIETHFTAPTDCLCYLRRIHLTW